MKTIPICVSDDMAAFIEQARLFLPKMGNLREEADNVLLNYKRHKEQTAQQATSKSLDEQSCIDLIEFIRSETTVNMGENGKEIDWTNKEKDCIKHIKNLFAHQPHPQDSSSGEVDLATQIQNLYKQLPECSLKDHMGKWFSYQGTNPLYNQVPPASESLEKAAKSVFPMEMVGGGIDKRDRQLQQNAFKAGAKWQSTQQQKPLVVLPDENDFMLWFKEMKYDRKTFDFAKSIWNEAVKKLSVANGVDPLHFANWCRIYDQKHPNEVNTIQQLETKYITEQSQQQNKGK